MSFDNQGFPFNGFFGGMNDQYKGHNFHRHPHHEFNPFSGNYGYPSSNGFFMHPHYYRPIYDYLDENDEVSGDQDLDNQEDYENETPPYYFSRRNFPPQFSRFSPEELQGLSNVNEIFFGTPPPEVSHPAKIQSQKETSKPKLDHRNEKANVSKDKEISSSNKFKSTNKDETSELKDIVQVSHPESILNKPFSPDVNLYNTENTYKIVVSLPGSNSKSFNLDYHPASHELIIKGSINDSLVSDSKNLKITEIKYGSFKRNIKFPIYPGIKDDEIKAKYSNGLLYIEVPKLLNEAPKDRPKKSITIQDVPDAELEFEKNPNPVHQ